jgi:hypothetical protein
LLFAAALSGQAAAGETAPALPPVAQLAEQGVETYRATFERATGLQYVDALGPSGVSPSVIFERRPGETPRVIVVAGGRRMEGPVSEEGWIRVRRAGLAMARAVGATHRTVGGTWEDICTGPILSTRVEMTPDWIRGEDGAPWRSWNESAICGAPVGSIGEAGDEMARVALTLLPPCDSLTEPDDVDPARSLARCLWLDGDRLAAAQFMSGRRWLPYASDVTAREWDAWMGGSEIELDWPGYVQWVELEGPDRVDPDQNYTDQADFLAEQTGLMDGLTLRYTAIRGDSEGRVTTRGLIEGTRPGVTDGDSNVGIVAIDHQVWERDWWGTWELKSWRVEPFRSQDAYLDSLE